MKFLKKMNQKTKKIKSHKNYKKTKRSQNIKKKNIIKIY